MAEDETQTTGVADEVPLAADTPDPADDLLTVSMPDTAVEPGAERPGSGFWLLAVLGVATAVLLTVLAVVDLGDVADDDWRLAGLWTAGIALALLGLALVVVAWRLSPGGPGWGLSRGLVAVAIVAVVGSAITVGLAQEQGGDAAPAPTSAASAVEDGDAASSASAAALAEPVTIDDALDLDVIVGSSLPVDIRTSVQLELTQAGRVLAAEAARCAPRDFRGAVLGVAIGGTWAQPLVLIGPPIDSSGESITRCHNAIIRLPLEAGLALPG